ncbi:hypothetical protein [Maribellus maritimus]|uniref:hypothetical protein n=1 Tax=Maribellus maritimus TaxID=2870838 RepID=UPI001EEA984B|nr:hypothetical protein [Maribellus maritimus]MCG6190891.1 hypothetical protein [Maribellus maritimus]
MKIAHITYLFLFPFMIISCINNNVAQTAELIKKSSRKFKEVKIVTTNKCDTISINEDSFIFDTTYNSHKADYVSAVYFETVKNANDVYIEFTNSEHIFYQKSLKEEYLKSLVDFYQSNQKYCEAQKEIFSLYNAEEQWNIVTALTSLKSEMNESFNSIDYFNYVLDASHGNSVNCSKLKLLHILIKEVKLENFWEKGGKRKDAAEFVEKSNNVLEILNCTTIDKLDTFEIIRDSI